MWDKAKDFLTARVHRHFRGHHHHLVSADVRHAAERGGRFLRQHAGGAGPACWRRCSRRWALPTGAPPPPLSPAFRPKRPVVSTMAVLTGTSVSNLARGPAGHFYAAFGGQLSGLYPAVFAVRGGHCRRKARNALRPCRRVGGLCPVRRCLAVRLRRVSGGQPVCVKQ